jgi:hypothetical protein
MIDMAPDRWQRLRPLLDRAIDLEGAERAAFLKALRDADETLRDELERLVDEHERLQRRALPNAAGLVTRALAREFLDELKQDDVAAAEGADNFP